MLDGVAIVEQWHLAIGGEHCAEPAPHAVNGCGNLIGLRPSHGTQQVCYVNEVGKNLAVISRRTLVMTAVG